MCPFHLIAHEASNLELGANTAAELLVWANTCPPRLDSALFFMDQVSEGHMFFGQDQQLGRPRPKLDCNQVSSGRQPRPGRSARSLLLLASARCWWWCARQRAMNIEYIVYSAYKEQRATWATEEQENMAQNQESVDTELMSKEG